MASGYINLPVVGGGGGGTPGGSTTQVQYNDGGAFAGSSNFTFDGTNVVIAGTLTASNLSGTNTGNVTLTAIGSTPNANGASLSGQAFTLQPASGSFPGILTIGAQTIAGAKTFSGAITASNLSGTNSGDLTLGTASGLSLVGQALSLGLASAGVTGALSGTDWSTFNSKQAAGTYVTAVSVTTANGVSGTSSGGATPALTLTLGAITPTTVNGNTVTTGTGTLTLSSFTLTVGATASISGTNSGDVTLAAVGSSPNANGASLSAQALTLQPADGTNPGLMTAGTQTLGGAKTFSAALVATTSASSALFRTAVGSAAAPSFAFTADTGTGLHQGTNGTGFLDVAVSGGTVVSFGGNGLIIPSGKTVSMNSNTVITSAGAQFRPQAGTAANPSHSFVSDTDTGMSAQTANTLILSTNGAAGLTVDSSQNTAHAGNCTVSVAGKGFGIKEGSNAKMGVSTLVAGTVTVSNTSVTANSRIFITAQSLGTVAIPQGLAVTTITASTSFVITSASATDTSVVAWMIVEAS